MHRSKCASFDHLVGAPEQWHRNVYSKCFRRLEIDDQFGEEFARRANRLGFGSTRFHDLRGIHATAPLDAGIPVHTVAQRIGDDPAVLLHNYAKRTRTKKADASLANAIEALAAKFLGV
jgi:hypothetical protein